MDTKTETDEDCPEFPSSTDIKEWVSFMEETDGNGEYIEAGLKEFKRLLDLEKKRKPKI